MVPRYRVGYDKPIMLLFGDASCGEDLTRWTIRLALLGCLASLLIRILSEHGRRSSVARAAWTAGCFGYLAHVACAFHFVHHWSHAAAYDHTARLTAAVTTWRWGGGVYVNYIFTLLWVADVAWWWAAPASHARRGRVAEAAWHGLFLFMVFNATVVFGAGPIRWYGLAGLTVLVAAWAWAQRGASAAGVSKGAK